MAKFSNDPFGRGHLYSYDKDWCKQIIRNNKKVFVYYCLYCGIEANENKETSSQEQCKDCEGLLIVDKFL